MARWIKIESATPDKPELRHIARLCNCSRGDAFLAFFRFFTWADEQTDDGSIEFVSREDVDEIAELPGFGNAMEQVRWIDFRNGGLFVAKWERHNGQSAKKRVDDAERKRKSRINPSQVVANQQNV